MHLPQPGALPVRLGAPAVQLRQLCDERYAADFEALAAVCAERGVAVQTIKASALAPWDGREQTAGTWYEPLREQADIDLAVHWVLGRPGIFLNTVGDVTLLPKVLDAASRYDVRPPDEAMDDLSPAEPRPALLLR